VQRRAGSGDAAPEGSDNVTRWPVAVRRCAAVTRTAVQLHQPAHEREPDAEPASGVRGPGAPGKKRRMNSRDIMSGDADTVIAKKNPPTPRQPAVSSQGSQLYASAGIRRTWPR